jgi:hypothetical protein
MDIPPRGLTTLCRLGTVLFARPLYDHPSRDEFIAIQWLHDFTTLSNELSGLGFKRHHMSN